MKKLNLDNFNLVKTQVRKYGNQFYCYAYVSYEDILFDLKDPFPSSNFPKYEAVNSFLLNNKEYTITEKDYRQLFKKLKNGKDLYVRCAEHLENNGIEFI